MDRKPPTPEELMAFSASRPPRNKYAGIPTGWQSLIPKIKQVVGDENVTQAKEKFGQLRVYHTLNEEDNVKLKFGLQRLEREASMLCMKDGKRAHYVSRAGRYGPLCQDCVIDDLVEAKKVKRL